MNKQVFIFGTVAVLSTLMFTACYEQYDNIEKYATEETVYVGRFSNNLDGSNKKGQVFPFATPGHNRAEIDLIKCDDRKINMDTVYMGKAVKTLIEWETGDGKLQTLTVDSIAPWVNIAGLVEARIYVFYIYAVDEFGNRSVPVSTSCRPFTDEDLNGGGYELVQPNVIGAPSTAEFSWGGTGSAMGGNAYVFKGLTASYVNKSNKKIQIIMKETDASFTVTDLNEGTTEVTIDARIIPKLSGNAILDVTPRSYKYTATTVSKRDYLVARAKNPRTLEETLYKSVTGTPTGGSGNAVIKWGARPDQLLFMEVRYTGNANTVRTPASVDTTGCAGASRGKSFRYRYAYQPAGTRDTMYSSDVRIDNSPITQLDDGWYEHEPFMFKYAKQPSKIKDSNASLNWTAASRFGTMRTDNVASTEWGLNGYPIEAIDGNTATSWLSPMTKAGDKVDKGDTVSFPQYIVIDMKASRTVSSVVLYAEPTFDPTGAGGYWKNVDVYVTNSSNLITNHNVDYFVAGGDTVRQGDYLRWAKAEGAKLKTVLPSAAWGAPQSFQFDKTISNFWEVKFPTNPSGQYVIVSFPDNTLGDAAASVKVHEVEVYTQ
jgi:hypothetical protein